MRLTALAIVLLAIATPAPAVAETVATGVVQRVTRPRTSLPHLVFVLPRGPRDLVLLGVTTEIFVGELYDVLDDHGWAGEVRVVRVERTDERCTGFYYTRATTETVAERPGKFDSLMAVGVGPLRADARQARLMRKDRGLPLELPPPGGTAALTELVDLDGDGTPELARYQYECAAGPGQKWIGQGTACIDEWGRAPDGWRALAHVEVACH